MLSSAVALFLEVRSILEGPPVVICFIKDEVVFLRGICKEAFPRS